MINKRTVAGFTLIETLITLAIVSVAVLSLGNFTVSMMGAGQLSRERLTAVHLSEQVLEFWQQDSNDYAPTIAALDCSLSQSLSVPPYPVSVTCTPTSGISISYTITNTQTQATGPLSTNLNAVQNFTRKGYINTPYTKVVTVSWMHKAASHSIYLTHLSAVK